MMNAKVGIVPFGDLTIHRDGMVVGMRGKLVGAPCGKGYRVASCSGKNKYVHHVVWEAFNGPIPNGLVIDHINSNRADNRLENLRLCTPTLNSLYRTEEGVWNPMKGKTNKYGVMLEAEKKRHWLGYYDTYDEAKELYDLAKLELIDTLETQMKKEYNL